MRSNSAWSPLIIGNRSLGEHSFQATGFSDEAQPALSRDGDCGML